jgi:hypothetical protein
LLLAPSQRLLVGVDVEHRWSRYRSRGASSGVRRGERRAVELAAAHPFRFERSPSPARPAR